MAWIESHTNIGRHPKVQKLRVAMRWNRFEVVGFLHCFWHAVLEFAPSGVVLVLPPKVMERLLDVPVIDFGPLLAELIEVRDLAKALEMKPALFASALFAMWRAKLLHVVENRLVINDWFDYAGRYLRDYRYSRAPHKLAAARVAHGLPECSADVRLPTKRRAPAVPDRTEPNLFIPARAGGRAGGGKKRKADEIAAETLEQFRKEKAS